MNLESFKIKTRFLLGFIAALTLSFPFSSYSLDAQDYTVQVDMLHSQNRYHAGGTYPILFRLKIKKPWYIHGVEKKEEFIFPTKLSFSDTLNLKIKKIVFPKAERVKFPYESNRTDVYSGSILVRAALEVTEETPEGAKVIVGKLAYQACTDKVCVAPEFVPISITFNIAPKGAAVMRLNQDLFQGKDNVEDGIMASSLEAGLLLALLGIFLGGMALNLTPWIYPLIPITVSYFSGRSQRIAKASTIIHGLLYILGLSLTNSILGLSAALSGGILGSALQNPFVLVFVACIMITLGLSFFDLWEFRLPAGWTKYAAKTYKGYFGTFFMGLTLGIVAAPCLGPFILGLLTYVGQQGDPFMGFLYFFILSIGMGFPLAILGIFSGAVKKLPMSGDWMLWIRKLMGWVLIGMTAYIINPLIPGQIEKAVLLTAIILAAGAHLGWLDKAGAGRRNFSIFKKGFGIFLFVGAMAFLFWGGFPGEGVD